MTASSKKFPSPGVRELLQFARQRNNLHLKAEPKSIGDANDILFLVDNGFSGISGPFTIDKSGGELLLTRNKPNNRIRTKKNVNRLEDQVNFKWKLNCEAMGFCWNGEMIDGQRRCMTVVSTGTPITVYCAFGLDPDAYETINTNTDPKTSKDLARADGNEHPQMSVKAATSYARIIRNIPFSTKYKLSPDDELEIYKRIPNFIDSIVYVKSVHPGERGKGLYDYSHLAAMHHIISVVLAMPKLAEKITRGMVLGENLLPGEALLSFRQRLIDMRLSSAAMKNDVKIKTFFKVIRFTIDGQTVESLKLEKNANDKRGPFYYLPELRRAVEAMSFKDRFLDIKMVDS